MTRLSELFSSCSTGQRFLLLCPGTLSQRVLRLTAEFLQVTERGTMDGSKSDLPPDGFHSPGPLSLTQSWRKRSCAHLAHVPGDPAGQWDPHPSDHP